MYVWSQLSLTQLGCTSEGWRTAGWAAAIPLHRALETKGGDAILARELPMNISQQVADLYSYSILTTIPTTCEMHQLSEC